MAFAIGGADPFCGMQGVAFPGFFCHGLEMAAESFVIAINKELLYIHAHGPHLHQWHLGQVHDAFSIMAGYPFDHTEAVVSLEVVFPARQVKADEQPFEVPLKGSWIGLIEVDNVEEQGSLW